MPSAPKRFAARTREVRTAGHREPASDFLWAASRCPAAAILMPMPRRLTSVSARAIEDRYRSWPGHRIPGGREL